MQNINSPEKPPNLNTERISKNGTQITPLATSA
jgi:hypothetical protein